MEFVLDGRTFMLDVAAVNARVVGVAPRRVDTHWVEIGGTRWPVKQAFSLS
ncbi:hypothetical protein [Embleya sp. NPDC059237]|uniref:hypothetical protein n=1 Tax=Embleya sp. NPDC059237 TaxID=3346784 RepID=UPI0036CE7F83